MDLKTHYKNLFLCYGDGPESAQYSDRITQEKRYEILVQIADINNTKILDFGSGTGHLATYLKNKNINVDYTGVDIVEELLKCGAQKHPEHKFCKMSEAIKSSYDYVFVSGVFNNKIEDNKNFYRETIKSLFKLADKGLAFNMMSYYVDYYDKGLFYEKPENVFKFIKQEISPYIVIRNDYQIKSGILPFEFAVYVYKKDCRK